VSINSTRGIGNKSEGSGYRFNGARIYAGNRQTIPKEKYAETQTWEEQPGSSPVFGATRVSIPPPGKENDDLRPTRVTERNILDASVGIDDLLRTEGYKIQLRLTALNLANKEALYNFLSTFSGTHFVTPRALQVELRLAF